MAIKLYNWYVVDKHVYDSGIVLGQIGIALLYDSTNRQTLMYFPKNNSLHNFSAEKLKIYTKGQHRWFVDGRALKAL